MDIMERNEQGEFVNLIAAGFRTVMELDESDDCECDYLVVVQKVDSEEFFAVLHQADGCVIENWELIKSVEDFQGPFTANQMIAYVRGWKQSEERCSAWNDGEPAMSQDDFEKVLLSIRNA